MTLGLDQDALASCVSCGLCLPHCPTWRVTGDEARSPRGRISAMREVELRGAPVSAAFVESMDTCVQCRGCETACPSGVPFGRLMADTRTSLAESHGYQPWWRRLGYRLLGHHWIVLAASTVLALAQRARLVPRRVSLPRLALRRPRLDASGGDVWLFTGCVMDAWQRPTHVATMRVLEATGTGVALFDGRGGCCGALAEHAGLSDQARHLARRVIAGAPGDAPVIVNSAGCGAMMKDYGHLLDTPEARAFSARVVDVHEWLAPRLEGLALVEHGHRRVAVQDPCHLRHVQHNEASVRTVLAPVVDVVELADDGLCCGAGGAFAALHPELAGPIRDRKLEAIVASGADVVASANPGCAAHLAAAGVDVRHPMDLVAEALLRR